jgi:ubiquinone biosynthesis protein UbiJ
MTLQLTLLLPALNHILAQEPWATGQLQHHVGKIACIDLSMASLRMQINGQGLLDAAPDDATANVTIRIDPADVPLILQDQQRAISYVKLEGDADLAQTISELGKNLRPDIGHELSKIFGDVAGQRMAVTGKALLGNLHSTLNKVNENLAEYFLEENPMLVRPERVAAFGIQVSRTRDDVERLMKRIEKLEKK